MIQPRTMYLQIHIIWLSLSSWPLNCDYAGLQTFGAGRTWKGLQLLSFLTKYLHRHLWIMLRSLQCKLPVLQHGSHSYIWMVVLRLTSSYDGLCQMDRHMPQRMLLLPNTKQKWQKICPEIATNRRDYGSHINSSSTSNVKRMALPPTAQLEEEAWLCRRC
jgi:hypothetical protein